MKIIAIDIDGVLNNYPQSWVQFANERSDDNYQDLYSLKEQLTHRHYKDLKHLYRTSGVKEYLPTKRHAFELLHELKLRGYFITIMTSRPINEYNNLLLQTINWLRKNNLEHDFLYFSDRKHLDIIEKFKNLEFMIEDNRAFANEVSKHGYRVFLVTNEYNSGPTGHGVIRVDDLLDILDYLDKEKDYDINN